MHLPASTPNWVRLVISIFLVSSVVLPLLLLEFCLTGTVSIGTGPEPSQEQIAEAVASIKPHAETCYESLHEDFEDVFGEISLEFEIIAENDVGRVKLVELDAHTTERFERALHDCLTERVTEVSLTTQGDEKIPIGRYSFVFNL